MTDNYQVKDLSSLKKYFAQIPNILSHLGFNLELIGLYTLFKIITGDDGECFMSNVKMAEKLGIGRPKLIELKQKLQQPHPLLGGKSLIKIEKRSSPEKGDLPDLITLEDIWPENFAFIASLKKKTPCNKPLHPPVTKDYTPCNEPLHKEDPIKKTSIKEESLPLTPSLKKARVEKKEDDEIFFECIKNENISLHAKRLVCDKYLEPQVIEAWNVTKQKCSVEAAREKYFLKVLENPPLPQKKHLSVYEELKQYFQHGGRYRNAECILNAEWIAFRRGMKHEQLELNKYWSWENLQSMCDSFGIKFARA
jgi:hypothetical protein